jgi:hypothetical protein
MRQLLFLVLLTLAVGGGGPPPPDKGPGQGVGRLGGRDPALP